MKLRLPTSMQVEWLMSIVRNVTSNIPFKKALCSIRTWLDRIHSLGVSVCVVSVCDLLFLSFLLDSYDKLRSVCR